MRLFHKELIPVLPRLQLISQWRECCLIAKSISEKGTPNHILVNRIMDYPISHFITYSEMISKEMVNRGYKCDVEKFKKYIKHYSYVDFIDLKNNKIIFSNDTIPYDILFCNWHNKRYLRECIYNLEEKVLCGGIPYEEWKPIYKRYKNKFDLYGKIDLWGDDRE